MLATATKPVSLADHILAARLKEAKRAFPGFSDLIDESSMLQTYLAKNPFDSEILAALIHDRLRMDDIELAPWKQERLRFYPPARFAPDSLNARLWAAQLTEPEHFPRLSHPNLAHELRDWIRATRQMRDLAETLAIPFEQVANDLVPRGCDWQQRATGFTPRIYRPYEDAVLRFPLMHASGASPYDPTYHDARARLLRAFLPHAYLAAVRAYARSLPHIVGPMQDILSAHLPPTLHSWPPLFPPHRITTPKGSAEAVALASLADVTDALRLTRAPHLPLLALGPLLQHHPVLITDITAADARPISVRHTLLVLACDTEPEPGFISCMHTTPDPQGDGLMRALTDRLMHDIYDRILPVAPTCYQPDLYARALDFSKPELREAYTDLMRPFWPGGIDLFEMMAEASA